jgi:hypothetical protein
MSGKTINPKSDLISQATERRTVFPQLALRRRSNDHPMVMFVTIVTAAFVWTLVPGETSNAPSSSAHAPLKVIQETTTTPKTSRLPLSDVDRACLGQSWGGESAECLKMIVRENGKAALKVRMIANAAPADVNTPNIF